MPRVTFVNEARTVEVPEGSTLLEAAEKADVGVLRGMWRELRCGNGLFKAVPAGRCGRCRVWATGSLDAITRREERDFPPDTQLRYACLAVVRGDVDVTTRPGWELAPS